MTFFSVILICLSIMYKITNGAFGVSTGVPHYTEEIRHFTIPERTPYTSQPFYPCWMYASNGFAPTRVPLERRTGFIRNTVKRLPKTITGEYSDAGGYIYFSGDSYAESDYENIEVLLFDPTWKINAAYYTASDYKSNKQLPFTVVMADVENIFCTDKHFEYKAGRINTLNGNCESHGWTNPELNFSHSEYLLVESLTSDGRIHTEFPKCNQPKRCLNKDPFYPLKVLE